MRPLTWKEVVRVLELNGFVFIRQSGSHMMYHKSLKRSTIKVVVPKHKQRREGTLRSIIRKSLLTRKDFNV